MQMWLVTRYEDVFSGLHDPQRLSSSRESLYRDPLSPQNRRKAQGLIEHLGAWLLNVDAERHGRLRKLVNLAFTPRMIRAMEPRIQSIVEQLLEPLAGRNRTDLVQSFCLPLPATVICQMLGVPPDRQDQFRRWITGLIPFSSAGGPGLNDSIDEANRSLEQLIEMFDDLIDRRRREPRDDLLSAMAVAEADGDRLSKQEMFGLCNFIFLAGHETTMGLLASGTLALLQHTDQFDMLKADLEGLMDTAIEEFLRYEPPVTRGVRRAIVDFTWHDRPIEKGQTVTMLIGAAHRDPEQFANPDRLDITRTPNKHLGFGFGPHYCLGAPLARMEAKIAFRALARRFASMRLDTDRLEYQPTMGIRSLKSLPVELR